MTKLLLLAVSTIFLNPATAATKAKVENCGWLVPNGSALEPRPDPALKPSDPAPLPAPPPGAMAAYCNRDTIMSYLGDERLIKLGLPFLIRSGDREGVLEFPPSVTFDYHREGEKYLPGTKQN